MAFGISPACKISICHLGPMLSLWVCGAHSTSVVFSVCHHGREKSRLCALARLSTDELYNMPPAVCRHNIKCRSRKALSARVEAQEQTAMDPCTLVSSQRETCRCELCSPPAYSRTDHEHLPTYSPATDTSADLSRMATKGDKDERPIGRLAKLWRRVADSMTFTKDQAQPR